jgi:hypothetical protein
MFRGLGGASPRVRQITQQRVERCRRAGQYGQAFFDKIWFHGRSGLIPNTQINVADQGFHLIPHRFEFRRLKSGLQTPLVPGFVRIFQQPHHVGKRVRVSLAAKNMASEETEPFEYIGGVRSYKVDSFRVAG